MKRRSPTQTESDEPAPSSESELRLSAWWKNSAGKGALALERANADMAYAVGHARGLEEGKEAQLDGLRTLLLGILESRGGELEEQTLDAIEHASLKELEDWIVRAAAPK